MNNTNYAMSHQGNCDVKKSAVNMRIKRTQELEEHQRILTLRTSALLESGEADCSVQGNLDVETELSDEIKHSIIPTRETNNSPTLQNDLSSQTTNLHDVYEETAYEKRIRRNNERTRLARLNMTPEEKQVVRAIETERMRIKRQNETPEEREIRKEKARLYAARKRALLTPQQREEYKNKEKERRRRKYFELIRDEKAHEMLMGTTTSEDIKTPDLNNTEFIKSESEIANEEYLNSVPETSNSSFLHNDSSSSTTTTEANAELNDLKIEKNIDATFKKLFSINTKKSGKSTLYMSPVQRRRQELNEKLRNQRLNETPEEAKIRKEKARIYAACKRATQSPDEKEEKQRKINERYKSIRAQQKAREQDILPRIEAGTATEDEIKFVNGMEKKRQKAREFQKKRYERLKNQRSGKNNHEEV